MTRETAFCNARVVLDEEVVHGSVLVRDGLIADIATGQASAGKAAGEDLDGDYLLPGLVELHTDHLEYHFQPRPGVHWDPLPAVLAHDAQLAASGATTVLDAVRAGGAPGLPASQSGQPRLLADAVELAADAGLLRADHGIHVRCEVSTGYCLAEFAEFADDPHLRLVSVMDHTPGQRQFADVERLRAYYIGKGRTTDAEFDAFVAPLQAESALHADGNRRSVAKLAAERGVPLAAHDDATTAHVEESVALGARIAEFPTTVAAAAAAAERGQLIVMGAPNIIRGCSQSGNVAAAELLSHGLLHILSSDYVPSSPLQAIFQLSADGTLPLPQGAAMVSGNPARSVGLTDRGSIAPGLRADMVRVRPHQLPPTSIIPNVRLVPVVRAVYRAGSRVS